MQQSLPSSILDSEFDENEKKIFIDYFNGLSVTESEEITLSKIYEKTKISHKKLLKVLLKYIENGNLYMKYAVKCPCCGRLIKEFSREKLENAYKISNCYICGSNIKITDKDIIVVFSVVYESPFHKGQNQNQVRLETFDTAQECDTLIFLKGIYEEIKRSNDIEQQKVDMQAKKEKKEDKLGYEAYKKYKINMLLRLLLNIPLSVLIGLIVYRIIQTTDNAKLSGTLSGITYIFVFKKLYKNRAKAPNACFVVCPVLFIYRRKAEREGKDIE